MDNAKLLWDLELAKQPISVQVARPLSEMSGTRNVSDLDIFFFKIWEYLNVHITIPWD